MPCYQSPKDDRSPVRAEPPRLPSPIDGVRVRLDAGRDRDLQRSRRPFAAERQRVGWTYKLSA